MATAKNGIFGPISGKIGNTYYYLRNGKQELRAARHKQQTPRSQKQLANEQRMALLSPFLNLVKLYVRVGFELTAKIDGNLPAQAAKSYNLKNAIKGEYPNQEINYPAVRLSEGNLAEPLNAMIESTANGFKFSWDYDPSDLNGSPYDRTMLMAWFPEKKLFFQIIDGAQRDAQEDFLAIQPALKGLYAETYISFITDDRAQISNSVYTGRIEF